MSTEITPDAIRDQDEAISLSYWLAEQMGEHVDDQGEETLTETVQRYVSREWMPKTGANPTPAPLDPSKVKAGDTVTLLVDPPDTHPSFTVAGETHSLGGSTVYLGGWRVDDLPDYVTLTDHQPAPEPEPEWKPGMTGTADVVREGANGGPRMFRRTRGMVVHRPAPIDDDMFVTTEGELWGLEGEYCKNFVPDATATCAHGQTAEDLCNAMPDRVELDAMWTAWKSLTPAEQRGWLEGGEGKVPTPAKVSIRTLMNGGAS